MKHEFARNTCSVALIPELLVLLALIGGAGRIVSTAAAAGNGR